MMKKSFEQALIAGTFVSLLVLAVLFFFKDTLLVFFGSLLMMCGYLSGMAVFGAKIRDLLSVVAVGDDIVLAGNVLRESLDVGDLYLKRGKLRCGLIPAAFLPLRRLFSVAEDNVHGVFAVFVYTHIA